MTNPNDLAMALCDRDLSETHKKALVNRDACALCWSLQLACYAELQWRIMEPVKPEAIDVPLGTDCTHDTTGYLADCPPPSALRTLENWYLVKARFASAAGTPMVWTRTYPPCHVMNCPGMMAKMARVDKGSAVINIFAVWRNSDMVIGQ